MVSFTGLIERLRASDNLVVCMDYGMEIWDSCDGEPTGRTRRGSLTYPAIVESGSGILSGVQSGIGVWKLRKKHRERSTTNSQTALDEINHRTIADLAPSSLDIPYLQQIAS
jgi:hypothetical protein